MKQISFPKSFLYPACHASLNPMTCHPERSPLHFSSFSNFNKSRDAACCVKTTHPSSISFFVFICINMSWCACPLLPLSLRPYLFLKNQKRALCTSTCVFSRFWEKSSFGEQERYHPLPDLSYFYKSFTRRTGRPW